MVGAAGSLARPTFIRSERAEGPLTIQYQPLLSGDLARRWGAEWSACAPRRAAAGRKLSMYSEAHKRLVLDLIDTRMGNAEVAGYVKRFASRSPCLLRAVVDALAVVYSRGCRRELVGVGEVAAKAFADIVAESALDRKGSGLNARAWLTPVLIAPHLDARNRLALDLVPADRYTARLSGDYVDAALWALPVPLAGWLGWESQVVWGVGGYIELDASGWTYYDASGAPTGQVVPHHVGVCPAVHATAYDNTQDPWLSTAHDGLADATLDVAYKMAYGLYIRQVAGTKLVWVRGQIEALSAGGGQSLGHPALPVTLPGNAQEIDIGMLDRIVPARDHLEEISAIITMAISAEGLPPGSVQMVGNNSDWGNLAVKVESDRLGLQRDRQVPFMRAAEMAMWPMAVDMLRWSSHRHARVLPPGDEVRDALRLAYPDLATPADRLARIEAMKAGLPYGISSPSEEMLASRPEFTLAAIDEERRRNLDTYIRDIEPLVSRNIPRDAPEAHGVQTIAQEQGRVGGRASGESRGVAA